MSRRAAIWVLGAVVGIVVTAAVTWATSKLTGQHIGLSSEPLSAGRSLAPASPQRPSQTRVHTTTTTVTRTHTSTSANGAPASSTTTAVITQTTQTTVREPESARPAPKRERDDGAGHAAHEGGQGPERHGPDD